MRPWNIIRGANRKGNWKRRCHAEGQLPLLLFSPHENIRMEVRVTERHQKICRDTGNLGMRDMSKRII